MKLAHVNFKEAVRVILGARPEGLFRLSAEEKRHAHLDLELSGDGQFITISEEGKVVLCVPIHNVVDFTPLQPEPEKPEPEKPERPRKPKAE